MVDLLDYPQSIEAMNESYLELDVNKEQLLNPTVSHSSFANNPFLLDCRTTDEPIADPQALCPKCKSVNSILTYVRGPGKEADKVKKGPGYVKELVTYMVMDNLEVKPLLPSISSVTLLTTFKVEDLSALETVEVCIGKNEALEMLKASFVIDKVFTSLFLHNQKESVEDYYRRRLFESF